MFPLRVEERLVSYRPVSNWLPITEVSQCERVLIYRTVKKKPTMSDDDNGEKREMATSNNRLSR